MALLLALRTAATSATVGGGGAGGLFVPLVVGGALVGRLCGGGLAEPTQTLFPVIGVAAFLGAGYRTPLAAVMFVAESTGRPGFIVPGLIATVVSQLMMGASSVSTYQSSDREGHLEHRFGLPLTAAIQGAVLTAPPDVTLDELLATHLLVTHHTTVPVVEHGHYIGLVSLTDLNTIPRPEWATTTVGSIARDEAPQADPGLDDRTGRQGHGRHRTRPPPRDQRRRHLRRNRHHRRSTPPRRNPPSHRRTRTRLATPENLRGRGDAALYRACSRRETRRVRRAEVLRRTERFDTQGPTTPTGRHFRTPYPLTPLLEDGDVWEIMTNAPMGTVVIKSHGPLGGGS